MIIGVGPGPTPEWWVDIYNQGRRTAEGSRGQCSFHFSLVHEHRFCAKMDTVKDDPPSSPSAKTKTRAVSSSHSAIKIVLVLSLSWSWVFSQNSGLPGITKIEPPNWWVGHSVNPVRLLVSGIKLQGAQVQASGRGVESR